MLYRTENVALQPYEESSNTIALDPSNLFNAMIYPFTRMVVYGSIWYQGKYQKFILYLSIYIYLVLFL